MDDPCLKTSRFFTFEINYIVNIFSHEIQITDQFYNTIKMITLFSFMKRKFNLQAKCCVFKVRQYMYIYDKRTITSHYYGIAYYTNRKTAALGMEVKTKAVVLNVSALVLTDITSFMRSIHGRKY